MVYYRMALQSSRTGQWEWRSTALSSLDAVFHLLRIYKIIPQDRLRVFSAPSKEELEERLRAENNGRISGSLTAAQLLHRSQEQSVRSTSGEQEELASPRSIGVMSGSARQEQSTAGYAISTRELSTLDKKRLEIEMGTGGDHNTPYRFALPVSTPQLLGWMRLQLRVRAHDLLP